MRRSRVIHGAIIVAALVAVATQSDRPALAGPVTAKHDARHLLVRVTNETDGAWTAYRHHHLLTAKRYQHLASTASSFKDALTSSTVNASTSCAQGAANAIALGRSGRRAVTLRARSPQNYRTAKAKMIRALRHAHLQLASCRLTAPAAPIAPAPALAPAPPPKPTIAGTVINSAGQAVANLPITVIATTSPRGEWYGHMDFPVTTAADGSFTIAQDPSAIGALRYRAEATFPWRGGSWPRDLTTIAGGDAQHLVFRSILKQSGEPLGTILTAGPYVYLQEHGGCSASGADPAYPVSDPDTHNLTFTFSPDGPLLDGSTAQPFSRTVTNKGDLCTYGSANGYFVEMPAGAWFISGVTDGGRRLGIGGSGTGEYAYSTRVFNSPQSEPDPRVDLNVVFGD